MCVNQSGGGRDRDSGPAREVPVRVCVRVCVSVTCNYIIRVYRLDVTNLCKIM